MFFPSAKHGREAEQLTDSPTSQVKAISIPLRSMEKPHLNR